MRDPRLAAAASSAPPTSSQPAVHQDVLPSPPGSAPVPGATSWFQDPRIAPRTSEEFRAWQATLPPFRSTFLEPVRGSAIPAYPDRGVRYVPRANPGPPEYYWHPGRNQTFLAVPVVEETGPVQAPPPPPPMPVHRVYTLRCSTCDTFLSDRGMRAVLLLKPHIVLFSTDARPCNTDTFWPDSFDEEEHVERTCQCLTSSVNCNGCGRTVGYNIVSPCIKCQQSVQKHSRSANHHRFVFHHNEVVARERSYYPGEKGVVNPIIPGTRGIHGPYAPGPTRPSSPVPQTTINDTDKDALDPRSRALAINSGRTNRSPTPGGGVRGKFQLKAGDTVYWHDLVAGGERAKPVDPRLREPIWRERSGR
ncbi:hypothetical protein JCM8547_008455 [Rhodosporidiobolus lusitaniae]